METLDSWICTSCGQVNTGDVLNDPCKKCHIYQEMEKKSAFTAYKRGLEDGSTKHFDSLPKEEQDLYRRVFEGIWEREMVKKGRQEHHLTTKGEKMSDDKVDHFVSKSCEGESCSICHSPATHKVGEEIMSDDPNQRRHNLTAYICCNHFKKLFGICKFL